MTANPVVLIALAMLQAAPSISIRVVDPQRAALPGIGVKVKRVLSCLDSAGSVVVADRVTDKDGALDLIAAEPGKYMVSVVDAYGFERIDECVETSAPGTIYVLLQLRLDLTLQVSTAPEEPLRVGPGAEVPVGSLVGAYRDNHGLLYGVSTGEGYALEVNLPGNRTMRFLERKGLSFSGPEGTAAFRVEGGRVRELTIKQRDIVAKRY